MRVIRALFVSVFVLILGVALGVGLIEAGLRFTQPAPKSQPARVAITQLTLPPALAQVAQAKPEDWLVFGAATAAGQGVKADEAFPALLSKKIDYPVYNLAALGGAGYLQSMAEQARKLGAKAENTVIALDIGNGFAGYANQQPDLKTVATAPKRSCLLGWLQHLRLYQLVKGDLQQAPKVAPNRADVERVVDALEMFKAQNKRLIVLVIPAADTWHNVKSAEAQEAVANALRRRGFFAVDLKFMLDREFTNPARDAYTPEGYLNAAGHEIAAKAVVKQIEVMESWKKQ